MAASAIDTFNMADIWEAVADQIPEREAIICGPVTRTYAEIETNANRIAHLLADAGVGPGDHVGIYLQNGPEWLETLLAAFKIRAVPININYRYVADELRYLFDDADLVALVHGTEYDDEVAAVASGVDGLDAIWSVGDGGTLAPAMAGASAERDFGPRRSDDHYVLYTGGTTGMPKGVVWHHEDAFFACIGGGDPMRLQGPVEEPSEMLERIIDFDFVAFPTAPLMHAAAVWTSLSWLLCGAKIVLHPGSFDPKMVWEAIENHQVATLIIVGDAMARPLVDQWKAEGPYNVESLFAIGSGGAPLSPHLKAELVSMLPTTAIADGFGSSETGAQGTQRIEAGGDAGGVNKFTTLGSGTAVLSDDLEVVEPGSGVVGRVALTGRIPQGYYNAPEKTAETFVEAAGARWVLTGDAATVNEDGSIDLLGRGSVSINTGGEKVYPEEVESALKSHDAVYDAVVVGVPDDRFGQRVCAVVQLADGQSADLEELAGHCRGAIAGYKVPRELVVVDAIVRSPVGKADYRWAKDTAHDALGIASE